MPLELSEAHQRVLDELKPAQTREDLQALCARVQPWLDTFVTEIWEPDQAMHTTRTELHDVYLLVHEDRAALAAVEYTDEHIARLRDTIRTLVTVDAIFSKQLRFKEWQPRAIADVVAASLPWRDKLRKKAAQVFFFDEGNRALFQDHNATGTIEEEVDDLTILVAAAGAHAEPLATVGFTAEDILEGQRLLAEAEGRDILAVIGIRSQAEQKRLRDKLLTLAVLLAKHARVTGESAHFNNRDKAARFERISFRNAMRRLHPAREKPVEPVPAPQLPATTEPVDA